MGLQTPTSGRKPVGKAQGVAGCRDPIRKDSRVFSLRHPHRGYSRLYQGLTGPKTLVPQRYAQASYEAIRVVGQQACQAWTFIHR